MSDPQTKSERSAAKDARQIPAPDKPSTGPKRKNRKAVWRVEIQLWGARWWAVCKGSEDNARQIYGREIRRWGERKPVRLLNPNGEIVVERGVVEP